MTFYWILFFRPKTGKGRPSGRSGQEELEGLHAKSQVYFLIISLAFAALLLEI